LLYDRAPAAVGALAVVRARLLAAAAAAVLASLGLAACGTSPATTPRARATASPHLAVTPASPSPTAAPSPSASASAPNQIDLRFDGAVVGSMTALEGHSCSAANGTVTLALEGLVAGRSYWVTLDISDPALGPGSWSIGTPPSQRQGGLENSTPQVGLVATSPLYGAAPGASGTVTLSGDPATTAVVEGTLAVTLVRVGGNSGSGSLSVSGSFGCPTS